MFDIISGRLAFLVMLLMEHMVGLQKCRKSTDTDLCDREMNKRAEIECGYGAQLCIGGISVARSLSLNHNTRVTRWL